MLRAKATLRVFSSDMSLEDLNSILGVCTDGYSKGTNWRRGKVREDSLWMYSPNNTNRELEDLLGEIFDKLDGSWRRLVERSGEVSIDVFALIDSDNGQGSFSLSSGIMRRAAQKDIGIVFDVYG